MQRAMVWGLELLGLGTMLLACGAAPDASESSASDEAELRPRQDPPDLPPDDPAPPPARPPTPAPAPAAPSPSQYADLELTGTLNFYVTDRLSNTPQTPYRGLRINVRNRGTGPTLPEAATIQFDTNYYSKAYMVSPREDDILYPGETGYLDAAVPAYSIAQCRSFTVTIDIDTQHRLQYPPTNQAIFANDTGIATTQCLTWESPLSAELIERTTMDSRLWRRSLKDFVTGVVPAPNGHYCSECHNTNSPSYWLYRPSFAPIISPDQLVSGRTWTGPQGWAVAFHDTTLYDKLPDLREAFMRWVNNGSPFSAKESLSIPSPPPISSGQ